MKRWISVALRILTIILAATVIWGLFEIISIAILSKVTVLSVPREGVWHCEELQAQFSFEEGQDNFRIVNGEKIACTCLGSNIRPELVFLESKETNAHYYMGQTVFSGRITKLKADALVLVDSEEEKEFTFVRVDAQG